MAVLPQEIQFVILCSICFLLSVYTEVLKCIVNSNFAVCVHPSSGTYF